MFKEIIEQGSLKGADRTQFYFDEPLRSIERDTMDEEAIRKGRGSCRVAQEMNSSLKKDLRDDDFIKKINVYA